MNKLLPLTFCLLMAAMTPSALAGNICDFLRHEYICLDSGQLWGGSVTSSPSITGFNGSPVSLNWTASGVTDTGYRYNRITIRKSPCAPETQTIPVPGSVTYRWEVKGAGRTWNGQGASASIQAPTSGIYVCTFTASATPRSSISKCTTPNPILLGSTSVVLKVDTIKFRIGTAPEWKDFAEPQKILFGKTSHLQATSVQPPGVSLPGGFPTWEGTYGVTASGLEVTQTYSGSPSTSDTDTKTVRTQCGPDDPEEFLVCTKVLGIHSNRDPDATLTDGHAWISLTDYSFGSPSVITYGLWPDFNPYAGDNGTNSDVRTGLEPASGLHNRYFLLSPSQYNAFESFRLTYSEWGYTYTCANWAEDAYHAATDETVESSDWVVFGTPRALAGSIITLETDHPTTSDMPLEGGEDASSTSTGSSWGGSSF